MTTVVVNQIEMQFVHLSAAEQLVLLKRPVQQSRLGGVDHGGILELPFEAPFVIPDLQHELDRTEELRAAEADLLSEIE
jgi:hypothetical protein